jgi:tetratricopeptide (TPR) repeat protein
MSETRSQSDKPDDGVAGMPAAILAAVRLSQRLEREEKLAPRQYRSLFSRTAAGRAPDGAPPARYRTLGLCDLLLAESRRAVFETPRQALELARLAVEIGGALDPAVYGAALVHDVQARAWGRVGNALRVLGDHRQAAVAFVTAEIELGRGSGDLLAAAELLDLEASALKSQRRYVEAQRKLDRVIGIYRRLHQPHKLGRAMISAGLVRGEAGELDRAVELLRAGLERIDPEREPRVAVCAQHNLRIFLEEAGRLEEAAALAPREAADDEGADRWTELRRRWSEGRRARWRGATGTAEAALTEARKGFVEAGLAYDAALVSLDLALVLADQGRSGEAKRLALEMLPIFRSCAVDREAAAALVVFHRAAELETVTATMLGELAALLDRGRPGRRG